MPLVVLLAIALVSGTLVALLGSRYPTPVIGQEPAQGAAEAVGAQAAKRPWLRRMLTRRLDPQAATGFALTIALAFAIFGGLLIGVLAYLTRSSGALVDLDNAAGEWGVHHATSWSTRSIQLVTDVGGTWFVILVALVVSLVEYARVPNRWIPVFLATVLVGEVVLVNTIKQVLDRVRPSFNPIAESLGPSFPSGHSATAAALYAAVALVVARRRSPRARALLAGAAAAIAVAVAESRVLLGVHWLSDVIAGLVFGWAWFALCAIAFGGRFLTFGAPAEKAAQVAEHEAPRSATQRR